MKIIILLTSPDYQNAMVLKTALPLQQYPSQIALSLAQKNGGTFGALTYLGCEGERETTNYIFHLFSKDKINQTKPEAQSLLNRYAKKLPCATSCEIVTAAEIHLQDLIKIYPATLADHPDKDALQNGGGFFNKELPYLNGVFNFHESINFIGVNMYSQNVPRGNHYHYHKVEYTYVLQGKIQVDRYLIDRPEEKCSITLNAGDMALFLPGSFHSVSALTETAYAIEASLQFYEQEDYYPNAPH